MRHASWVIGCTIVLLVTSCATAPTPPTPPAPSATQAAMVPSGTPMVGAATSTPAVDQGQAGDGPRPTITINPHLHATNPQHVKLASGDQPTLVEFFAFW